MSRDATDLALDALELDISPEGAPRNPILVVPLDVWAGESTERIARVAEALAGSLRLSIGVLRGPASPSLVPLLRALTLTLAEDAGTSPMIVDHPDPDAAVEHLTAAVRRNPQASVALGRLLRQTTVPDTTAGLGAEAAVYSMLLAGSEFERWLAERGGPKPVRFPDRPLVRLDRDADLLSVVLDHPERRNALSSPLREQLLEALRLAELDDSIDRVLLRGAGPVFCSGGDLDEFGTAVDVVAAYQVRLERAPWRIIDRLRDHVCARVHGACIGAGIEMTAFAGKLIAAPETYFRLPEIEMGLVPGAGGTVSVPRRIGRWRAAWMMLTGDRVDTATALRWKLIDGIEENAVG
ncbi:enoyl-CoA hydratase/isomerase family protein [Nocardia sp. NPDC058519]|uniref:enoyl-CoA hydratase/isomerase family protein n=1 Tax=Nocardia sp. NPDC058519 TaxID=3346535 RepID=UPI0036542F52